MINYHLFHFTVFKKITNIRLLPQFNYSLSNLGTNILDIIIVQNV